MNQNADYTRAREIFEAACETPKHERIEFLHQACGGNDALFAEVVSLLEFDTDCDDPLSDDAMEREQGLGAVAAPHSNVLDLPERIASFRVIRRLGEGGMGEVYEAEQDAPRRRVALKVMSTRVASKQLRSRFRRESEIQGLLRHPGIAQVYETGVASFLGRHVPYFAMELVDGVRLTSYAEACNLGTDDRLRLMIQVCDAVGAAHELGIMHRDLKPDNILVEATPSGPRVKVLDFGVAKLTDVDPNLQTLRTEVGQLVGTLAYMSPEQVAGDTEKLDERSDVYALGVILYELLAGHRPFHLAGRSIPQAARIIQEHEPTSLSSGDRSHRGDIQVIVGRALDKVPSRRYATAGDLGSDLRRLLEDQPIEARPPSLAYRAQKFAKRNRPLVGGVVATLLTLTVGLVAAIWLAVDAASERDVARWQAYRTSIIAASNSFGINQPGAALRLLEDSPEEHRGWEFDHFSSRASTWERILGDGDLVAVSVNRAENQVIGITDDGTMTTWDPVTGSVLRSISAGLDLQEVSAVAPNGTLAALSASGKILLIDTNSGELTEIVAETEADWSKIEQSEDGSTIMVYHVQDYAVIDIASKRVLHQNDIEQTERTQNAESSNTRIRSMSIGPIGRRLAMTKSRGQRIESFLIDTETGTAVTLAARERPLGAVFSRDGSTVAVRNLVRNIHVYRTEAPAEPTIIKGHTGTVAAATFLEDGRIASLSDGVLRVAALGFPESQTALLSPVDSDDAEIAALAGSMLVVVSRAAGRAWVVDVDTSARGVLSHPDYVYGLAWSSNGSRLATQVFKGNATRLWDANDAELLQVINRPSNGGAQLVFSQEQESLLFLTDSKRQKSRLIAFDTRHRQVVHEDIDAARLGEYIGSSNSVRLNAFAAFSPDGRTLVRRTGESGSREWSLSDDQGGELRLPSMRGGRSVVWHPSGRWFAACFNSPTRIETRNGATGEVEHVIHVPSRPFTIDIHPEGNRLVVGCEDSLVRLYDTERFDLVAELSGHTSYVYIARFSPDGTRLATGSGDKTVRIWDSLPISSRRPQRLEISEPQESTVDSEP